ncbi:MULTISPECIES: MFS transporter [Enterobacterales]|jgi:D-galactonate transporter|uniref:D-galactonate transporter n=1 Tax=Candidatus Pantoea symbiotica TaxID=1884370 RepID=A0A1I4A1G8_9GAMM|nr:MULTISPECIES: MFS transporter [Enterobacterales]MRT26706.1 MFS transporter [Enterobacteriaceae bacterium RIT697]KAJ9430225.1 MFS transporter [Pantoea sp. YR343]MBB3307386.1 D-galactonate transporter [Enterobacter sp. Sphag1F]NYI16009.1 D-galactonate transporter [Enterobacter sp. Sphag71]SFK50224.1 D-galactonate transporter [Pantoea symbiotica]
MRRYPRIRWLMIVFCFFAIAINYIDRINLAIAAPHIKADLGLDDTSMGLILGAFFWTYALMQIPAGRLLDRLGARAGLAIAVGWWSLFTVFTSFGKGFTSLFAARLALGLGEAGGNPGCVKVVYSWFPKKQRATASGIFDAGPRAGSALALPLVAWLISVWDWETSFIVTGALGLIWVVIWLVFYREPEEMKGLDETERQNLLEDRALPTTQADAKVELWSLFRHRNVWGMMIGFFCMNFATYFFVTWFPTYLTVAHGFSLKELGTLGAIPALMGIPGSLLGGIVSDTLYRKGFSLTAARKTCLISGMLLSSVIAFAAFTDSITVILTLFSITYAGLAFTAANIWTLPADVAPASNYVATLGGIQNFAGNLAGIVTASFTGLMLSLSHGSFVVPLLVAGGICVLGALTFMFVLGKLEPLPISPKPDANVIATANQ